MLMSPSTVPRRSSERLETILAASRGHLEGLGRVGEVKMAPRCVLEGRPGELLGAPWKGPAPVLGMSWGCPGGHVRQDDSQRPPGDGFEGVCGGSRGHLEGFGRCRGW